MDRTLLAPLALFTVVARTRSFRAAGRELSLSPSAISHAVSSLEASLGVRLLNRTTRSVSPTPEGSLLLEHAMPAFAGIEGALAELEFAVGEPSGTLRVSLSRSAFEIALAPRLEGFRTAHPQIVLDLDLDDRMVDLPSQGFDAGIRLHEAIDGDMIAVRAGPPMRLALFASPDFVARNGAPRHPSELERHDGIVRRFERGLLYRWEFSKDGESLRALPRPSLVVNDTAAAIACALSGAGIAMAFEAQVVRHIEAGRLCPILRDWLPAFDGFSIFYPSKRQMRPALRAFVDHFRHRTD